MMQCATCLKEIPEDVILVINDYETTYHFCSESCRTEFEFQTEQI